MSDEWPDFGSEFESQDIGALRSSPDVGSSSTDRMAAEARMHRAKALDAELDVDLKQLIGRSVLVLMGMQVLIADMAFFFYGFAANWAVPDPVIIGWMSAAVVEVIGVVLIIARHLFPGK